MLKAGHCWHPSDKCEYYIVICLCVNVVSHGSIKRVVGAAVSLVRMVSGLKWELTVAVDHFSITALKVRGKSSS